MSLSGLRKVKNLLKEQLFPSKGSKVVLFFKKNSAIKVNPSP
jgi:hypothetical protein